LGSLDISSGKSEEFNKLIRAIGNDITTVFNMSNSSTQLANQNTNVIVQENLFLQKRVQELEEQLASIERTMSVRSNGQGYNFLYKTFYTAEGIEYNEGSVAHDTTYGVITLPNTNTQKIPFLKYSKEFLKKNLDIKATIGNVTIDMANDPNLINIIDGDDATFWFTEVNTNEQKWGLASDAPYVDYTVTINMPMKLLSSLTVNSVGVKPHPMYSTTLRDIKYIDVANGTESRIATFPTNLSDPQPIESVDSAKFMFPTINTKSITFYFRQPYYKQDKDSRVFIIGIRNLDLESINVTSEQASFMTEFRIPGDNRYFLRVLEPETVTLNNENYGDAVIHELFYDKVGTTPFPFGSDIIADIDTIYIKTTLKRTGDSIPAIRGIRLQYLPK
jgi:hypothetical protein